VFTGMINDRFLTNLRAPTHSVIFKNNNEETVVVFIVNNIRKF